MNYITDMRIEAVLQLGFMVVCFVFACVALSWFIEHDRKARAKEISEINQDNQDINTRGFDDE